MSWGLPFRKYSKNMLDKCQINESDEIYQIIGKMYYETKVS